MRVYVVCVVPGGGPWPRPIAVLTDHDQAVGMVNRYRASEYYAGAWIVTFVVDGPGGPAHTPAPRS